MSLQTRLEALATAIGNDIKWLSMVQKGPIDYAGYLGATFDPATASGAAAPPTQILVLNRVICETSGNVTKLSCGVGTAGASLTYARMGIFSLAGVQLGVTGDMIASFQSAGIKEGILAGSAVPVVAGTEYFVGALMVGTTPAALVRGYAGATVNAGYAAAPFRFHQVAGSQATMPASFTPTAGTAYGTAFWMAMK